ncbi:MAG: Gfo/Idh/MocA family oxidoreductase, partial [Bacillota bacterium]
VITYSIGSDGNKNIEISGEHGRIIAPDFFSAQKSGEESFYLYGGKSYSKDNVEEFKFEATDLYQEEIEAVSEAFMDNLKVQPYPEESIKNQEIIELMFESDKKAKEIELN